MQLAENTHFLINGGTERVLLCQRDDAAFQLFQEHALDGLGKNRVVLFPAAVQDWIFNGFVQIEWLDHISHAVGVLDGLKKNLLGQRVLCAEGGNQLVIGFIGQIESVLVGVALALILDHPVAALRLVGR